MVPSMVPSAVCVWLGVIRNDINQHTYLRCNFAATSFAATSPLLRNFVQLRATSCNFVQLRATSCNFVTALRYFASVGYLGKLGHVGNFC